GRASGHGGMLREAAPERKSAPRLARVRCELTCAHWSTPAPFLGRGGGERFACARRRPALPDRVQRGVAPNATLFPLVARGMNRRVPLQMIFLFHLATGSRNVHGVDSTGDWRPGHFLSHPPLGQRACHGSARNVPDTRLTPRVRGPRVPGHRSRTSEEGAHEASRYDDHG